MAHVPLLLARRRNCAALAKRRGGRHPDWHDAWLRETLDELEIPYILSIDVVREALPQATLDELFVPENGHPSTWFNQVITDAIARRVVPTGEPGPAEPASKASR